MEYEKRRANGVPKMDLKDPENSKWIHRDKLARIERTEMEQAGIFRGRESRAGDRPLPNGYSSRDQSIGSHAKGYSTSEIDDTTFSQPSSSKRQRIASPIPDERVIEDGDEDDGGPATWGDLRLPDEAAQDPFEESHPPQTPYKHHNLSASASKIPVHTSSPIPIPYDYLERTAPVPRYAAPYTDRSDDDRIAYPRSRSRGHSFGSQLLLDDGPGGFAPTSLGTPTPATRAQSSPKKQGQPGSLNGTPRSASGRAGSSDRKTSANSAQPKARTRSANQRDVPRPGTRSGLNGEGRPDSSGSNGRRPEGDPPWLNGIYAPDPHLPPEQQLLPTVAKRLKQQEWERDGKDPDQNLFFSEYDKDLNALRASEYENRDRTRTSGADFDQPTHDPEMSPTGIQRERTPEPLRLDPRQNLSQQYPHRTPSPMQHRRLSPVPPEAHERRPSTSNGNYKTTPTMPSPPMGHISSPRPDQMEFEQREPRRVEKQKKGGMCACCVIM